MKIFYIIIVTLLLSSCENPSPLVLFSESLKQCHNYTDNDNSESIHMNITGLTKDGMCSVNFEAKQSKKFKLLNCHFNARQRKDIAMFLIEFESQDISRSMRVNYNKSPWTFNFELEFNAISNPLQEAIDQNACSVAN